MKILILGGGISGLSAAWYARKKYPDSQISIVEKTGQLGGWIQTSREGGFLFEKGPRTFVRNRCPHLLELIEEMGLSEEIIYSDSSASRRFLLENGKLRSAASFLPRLIFPLLKEPFIPRGKAEDESIYDFAKRRLGKKIATTLIDALALGVFAGDIHKLSVRSCFPFLCKWEEKWGSLVLGALFSKKNRGPKGLFTLKQGMGGLIEALAKKSKAEIRLNETVEEIRQEGALANGRFYPANLIIPAFSGSELGRLTGLWNSFAETDLSIVHLAYQESVLPKKGFGYLAPTQEKENLLGMVWDSAIFPEQNISGETRVTAMMREGGVEAALNAMRLHLGISVLPTFTSSYRAKGAIPQFHVGYRHRLARFEKEIKEKFPSFLVVGNYLRGASLDSCIGLAKERLSSSEETAQFTI